MSNKKNTSANSNAIDFATFKDVLAQTIAIVPFNLKVGATVKVESYELRKTKTGKNLPMVHVIDEDGNEQTAIVGAIPQLKKHLEAMQTFKPFEILIEKEYKSEYNGKTYNNYLISFA